MNSKFTFVLSFLFACVISNAQINLSNGLVACYPFKGNASDHSGNGYNGIVIGATLTSDRFGNSNSAYLFNGSSDYIEVNNNVISSKEFSISFWAKTNLYQGQIAFMLVPDNISDRFAVSVNYNHTVDSAIFWDFGDIFGSGRSSNYPITYLSKWEHYIFISSASKDSMLVYRDNNLLIAVNHSDILADTTRTLKIGSGDNANYFNGIIDDIKIYNRALNVGEAESLFKDENSCDIQTSNNENDKTPINYSVFPNPCNGKFTVNFSNLSHKNQTLKVYDIFGKLISCQKIDANLENSTLQIKRKGLYFLSLESEENRTTKKIVVE